LPEFFPQSAAEVTMQQSLQDAFTLLLKAYVSLQIHAPACRMHRKALGSIEHSLFGSTAMCKTPEM